MDVAIELPEWNRFIRRFQAAIGRIGWGFCSLVMMDHGCLCKIAVRYAVPQVWLKFAGLRHRMTAPPSNSRFIPDCLNRCVNNSFAGRFCDAPSDRQSSFAIIVATHDLL